ncbi:MAG TPA: hypothetical protein VFW78_12625, partial [Bacteroidia bacterium]|nr:hypothetical protein [Bacteroidia bacterium]
MKTTRLTKQSILILSGLVFILITASVQARENPGASHQQTAVAKTASGCTPATAVTDLNINNVRATLLTGGDMWWNLSSAGYEVPVGSGKHSIFCGALWIGGMDNSGNLHVAAQTYRQTGLDFWPGALDTTTVNITPVRCLYYDRFWKINRADVATYIQTGTATADILSWPGNGDPVSNEGHFLAPFVDVNGDGLYNTVDGDYPGFKMSGSFPNIPGTTVPQCHDYLFGDRSIWWVINDEGNVHTSSGGNPFGLEIRCQAFAYASTEPAINNATFYKYQAINRSSQTYNQMYFGLWVDPDLGNYDDDYVGCNVPLSLGYCYNGDPNDDGSSGYGLNPPVVGVDFMEGPSADFGDGIDNDHDGCVDCTYLDSAGVTLTIPDNIYPESVLMSKFMYYENVNNNPVGNPNGAIDYFHYLNGIWLDNEPISYGGTGRLGSGGNTGVLCNYMFPDDTDPDFQQPTYQPWSEYALGNPPGDRRFIMSAGAFTMQPGEVKYVTSATLWARDLTGGQLGSIPLLEQY